MPFVLRQVTPISVCNQPISGDVDDELQAISNQALCGILGQLSSLVLHADGILGELMAQFQRLAARTEAIQARVQTLKLNCDGLDARSVVVPESDLTTFSRRMFCAVLSTPVETTGLFTEKTRPPGLQEMYSACQLNPVVTLRHLDPFRRDGMRSSKLFKCTPIMEKDCSASMLDIETRTPEELDFLPDWVPNSDILHPVHPDIRLHRINSSNQPVLRKLPTPNQLSIARSRLSCAEFVPTDTSGSAFQRLVQFRRSLTQISYAKQKQRRKSRKSRQNFDDSENLTAESTEKSFDTGVLLKCDTPTSTDSTNGNVTANNKTKPGRNSRCRGDTDSGRGSRTSHRASSDPDSGRHRASSALASREFRQSLTGGRRAPGDDTDDASSAFSCDAEGYYTSFHCDSGLKWIDANADLSKLRAVSTGDQSPDENNKRSRKTPPPLPPPRSETTLLSSAIETACDTPEPGTDGTVQSEQTDKEQAGARDNEEVYDERARYVTTPLSRHHGLSSSRQNNEKNLLLTPTSSMSRSGALAILSGHNSPCMRSLTAPRPVPPPPRGRLFSSLDRRTARHPPFTPSLVRTGDPPRQESPSEHCSTNVSVSNMRQMDPTEVDTPTRADQPKSLEGYSVKHRFDFPPPPVSLEMDISPTSSTEEWPYEGLPGSSSHDANKFKELRSFLRASSPRDTATSQHTLENNFVRLKELSLQQFPDITDTGVMARLGFHSDSHPVVPITEDLDGKQNGKTKSSRRSSFRLPRRNWRMPSGFLFSQQSDHSRTDEQKLNTLKSLKFWSLKRTGRNAQPESEEDSDDGGFKEYRESSERSLRVSSDSFGGPSRTATPLTDISFSSFSDVGQFDCGSRLSVDMSSACCLTSTPNQGQNCHRIFLNHCETTLTDHDYTQENKKHTERSKLPHCFPLQHKFGNHDTESLNSRVSHNYQHGKVCQTNVQENNHNLVMNRNTIKLDHRYEHSDLKNGPIHPASNSFTKLRAVQHRTNPSAQHDCTHTSRTTAPLAHTSRALPVSPHQSTTLSQFKALVASKRISPVRASAADRLLAGKFPPGEWSLPNSNDPAGLVRSFSLPTRIKGGRLSLHRTNIIDTTIPESDEEFQQYSPD